MGSACIKMISKEVQQRYTHLHKFTQNWIYNCIQDAPTGSGLQETGELFVDHEIACVVVFSKRMAEENELISFGNGAQLGYMAIAVILEIRFVPLIER